MANIFTLGHGAYSMEIFSNMVDKVDILVDIRKKPYSHYQPQFNKENIECTFPGKYLYRGNELGGSYKFHNELIEFMRTKGIGNNSRLCSLVSENDRAFIFSKSISNDRKRKEYITQNYLHYYIDGNRREVAIETLRSLLLQHSEKDRMTCHRYYLLTLDWLGSLGIHEHTVIEITPNNEEHKQLSLC